MFLAPWCGLEASVHSRSQQLSDEVRCCSQPTDPTAGEFGAALLIPAS